MVILPEGMFIGVRNSDFGIFSGQTRGYSEVIITQAGWYNQLGQVLGEGDLAFEDFVNIFNSLPVGYPNLFVVVPARDTPHKQLSLNLLAERCAFIVLPNAIHIVAPPSIITEHRFEKRLVGYVLQDDTEVEGPMPYIVSSRAEAHYLLSDHTLH